ncbi:MAG: helix-turn-helix domain-containing protein [Ignavibacteriales bacterium]|nr:helix-turn-helix domain-containing protein [Ignavibacteriales bacterium]
MIFNNSAINNLCGSLPLTKDELLKVKGFKKAKADTYGDKIISLVKEYCRQNNVEPSQKELRSKNEITQTVKSNSVSETIKLFNEGKSIDEIAKDRNLVISTIESHFAQAIKQNIIQIEEIMTMDEAKTIAEYFSKDLNEVRLASIKEKAR